MLCNCSLSALLFYGLMIIAFEIKSCVLPFSLFLQLYCWISKMQHYLQALKLNTFIFAGAIYTILAGNSWQLRDKSVKSILTESFSLSGLMTAKLLNFKSSQQIVSPLKIFSLMRSNRGRKPPKCPKQYWTKYFGHKIHTDD